MTTIERWLLATVIALLVGLWHAWAARAPKSGPGRTPTEPTAPPRPRPSFRRTTRRAALARRVP